MKKPEPDPALLPFRQEKTLAVGILALLAPVPLAFTYSLEWPVLLAYVGLLGALLLYVRSGRVLALSNRMLNLIGVSYLALAYVDLRLGSRTLLRTTLHLLLFTTIAKLTAVRRERDFSITLALSGFLFLASVATSFHYAIVPFLVFFSFVAWPILVRWALWRDLAAAPDEWRRDRAARALPGWRSTVTSLSGALLVATPLFFMLPRLKAPYVRGVEQSRDVTTGFSEQVNPDTYGVLKRSDHVYLRITTDEPISHATSDDLRLRALAFSRYDGRTWQRPERSGRATVAAWAGELVPLVSPGRVESTRRRTMTIDLSPLGSRYVPYPLLSPALRFSESTFRATGGSSFVEQDDARNVKLPYEPDRTIQYDALYSGPPVPDTFPPSPRDPSRQPLDSPRIAAFARELVAGVDPAAEPERAARRVEAYLSSRFAYTLEIPRSGPNPVEEFLFERKRGHCESFATGMALALREIGIPTRFVTGFSGGEIGLFGRYLIVRGTNAHAWVEAWCGKEKGWVSFDPTPAAGRPGLETVPWSRRLKQATDGVEFFYDRYVLSFGQGDQVELVKKIREIVESAKDALAQARERGRVLLTSGSERMLLLRLAIVALLAGTGVALIRRALAEHRRWGSGGLTPASAAYRRLQKLLRRKGAALTPASAPAETLDAAEAFGPAVARPSQEIVKAYVAESFGGRPGGDGLARRLHELIRAVRDGMKRPA